MKNFENDHTQNRLEEYKQLRTEIRHYFDRRS